MSQVEEIDIVIDANGKVSLDVHGVTGPDCEALTRPLEQALAGRILDRRRKDAFHQAAAASDRLGVGQRG